MAKKKKPSSRALAKKKPAKNKKVDTLGLIHQTLVAILHEMRLQNGDQLGKSSSNNELKYEELDND